MPGSEARKPAADRGAVEFKFCAEGAAKRGFFVDEYPDVEAERDEGGVFDETETGEIESLAEDEADYSKVDGIADVAVEAGDDEMLVGKTGAGVPRPWRAKRRKESRRRVRARRNRTMPAAWMTWR